MVVRKFTLALAGLPLIISLGACDRLLGKKQPDISERFGISYDDCLLRGLTAGVSKEAAEVIRSACKRVWEQQVEEYAAVGARLTDNGGVPSLTFDVENYGKSIATQIQIAVEFETESKPKQLYWTYNINLEPGEETELYGSFDNDKPPSTNFKIITDETQFVSVLKVQKAFAP